MCVHLIYPQKSLKYKSSLSPTMYSISRSPFRYYILIYINNYTLTPSKSINFLLWIERLTLCCALCMRGWCVGVVRECCACVSAVFEYCVSASDVCEFCACVGAVCTWCVCECCEWVSDVCVRGLCAWCVWVMWLCECCVCVRVMLRGYFARVNDVYVHEWCVWNSIFCVHHSMTALKCLKQEANTHTGNNFGTSMTAQSGLLGTGLGRHRCCIRIQGGNHVSQADVHTCRAHLSH